jgi:hemolysin activation/secretion protein
MLGLLLLWPTVLPAQPGSGGSIADHEIQRQEEIERQRRQEMADQAPDVRFQTGAVPEEALAYPENEAPCLLIKEIVLEGREAERFQWALKAVKEAEGRCLGGQGLNTVMSRVQNVIVKKGYVTTRMVAAPQDLSSGRLILTVIPGRVSGLKLAPGSDSHIVLSTAVPISKGDILNIRDIEQGLENLKRAPTVTADIQLLPGDEEGESEIVITWRQGRPFRVFFSMDDSGSEYTGRYQGTATLSLDNVLGFSDLFYASISRGLEQRKPYGTRGHSFYYSLPVGYWEFTVSTNYYDYHQEVAGYQSDYEYSGISRNTTLEAARVLHRGARSKTTASFSGFVHNSRNYIDDTEIEIQRRRMGGWEAAVNHRHYLGALTLDTEVRYHRGTGAFDALPAPEERVDEGSSRPEIWNLNLRAQYPFQLGDLNFRYLGNWRQQWAMNKLVSRDRLSIGGRYTVKGYSGDMTLSADNGFVFRNELGLALGQSGQELYAGLDFGRVWGPFDEYLLGQSLSGATLGLRGYFKGLNYDVFASRPVNRPEMFPGDRVVMGFNVGWQF